MKNASTTAPRYLVEVILDPAFPGRDYQVIDARDSEYLGEPWPCAAAANQAAANLNLQKAAA